MKHYHEPLYYAHSVQGQGRSILIGNYLATPKWLFNTTVLHYKKALEN